MNKFPRTLNKISLAGGVHFSFSAVLVFLLAFSSCKRENSGQHTTTSPTVNNVDSVTVPVKVNYNIYIDNSASMDGFVTVGSDFKNAVLGIISDLKSKSLTDTISLFFINKQICPQKTKAVSADIIYFINNLNPVSFKNSGCERTTTYIPNILKNVITQKKDDVNILISDNIFSDSAGTSPSYLESAENSTKLFFSDELHKNGFSSILLKLNSKFTGVYYVESQRPLSIDVSDKNIRRPYYIMAFGKRTNLRGFLSKLNFNDYKGFENSYYLLTPEQNLPVSKVVRNNKIGDFEIKQPASKLVIENAKPGGRGGSDSDFQFSLATNLGFLYMDDSYLLDPNNYEVPPNYKIVSIARNDDPTNESLKGFTHVFILKTTDLKQKQEVVIKLKSTIPRWVTESSTVDDADPVNISQQKKTFGLEYLVRGISRAYTNEYNDMGQFAITVRVSENTYDGNQSHSGWLLPLIVIMFILVGIIIWAKNKK